MAKHTTVRARDDKEFRARVPAAPAGFKRIETLPTIEAWWRPAEGATIQCVIRKRREGEERPYYVVELTAPAIGYRAGDDEGSEYPEGTLFGFSETGAMGMLKDYEDKEVFLFCQGKKKLRNGREMWDIVAYEKEEDNDVPF
jgi:hypothetical protein